jgi:iron complex outermembrane receptor protein
MIRKLAMTALLTLSAPVWSAETPSATAPATPDQEATARTQSDEGDVVVTGTRYRSDVATGGARIGVDVKDLPLSISVVTKALIDDREVRNIRDLAENVAGVRSRGSGTGAFAADFTVRGLQGGSVAVNGFRVENFSAGFDPQVVDRVEFLKGPASVLYGASGALSGLVNIVTKTPKRDDFLDIDMTGGIPGYGRAAIDANTRLTDKVELRINGALTNEKQLNAFRDVNEQFASASIRWRPTSTVSLLVEGNYFNAVQPSRGVVNYLPDVRLAELPRRFKTGEPYDRDANTGFGAHGEATWEILPGLTLRQGLNYQQYRDAHVDVRVEALIGPNQISRSASRGDEKAHTFVSQSEIRWNFNLGAARNKFLAGYERSRGRFGGICCDSAPVGPLDLNNPVYGDPEPMLGLTQFFENRTRTDAFYAQDFIEIGKFKILAGVRHDSTTQSSAFCDLTDPLCAAGDPVATNLGSSKETALSPRLGVVWQPSDRTTLYVSYAKSFNPTPILDRNNQLLPPERGIQYEAGIRQELLDPGKLLLSLAAFDLTRRNIADCDPLFPDCSRGVAIGEQRVRGAEAELSGKPTPWIDVIGTFTYLDGKVTKNDPSLNGIPVGSRLPEAAPYSTSLFTKVGLDPLGASDVSLSVGVYYVSRRPGRDFFGSFTGGPFARPLTNLPASTRIDLGAYWEISPVVELQANLTNAFDVKVYEPANIGFNISQRRRFTLGAKFRL